MAFFAYRLNSRDHAEDLTQQTFGGRSGRGMV